MNLSVSKEDISALFPPLSKDAHKGDMGRVLCICGSYDGQGMSMCGAAYFSAAAAYRTGAGVVGIFTARKNYEGLTSRLPEAVFSLYDTEKETDREICVRLCKEIKKADSVVLGCGLGRSDTARSIVKTALENVSCPLVIDADALNIISEDRSLFSLMSDKQKTQTVITPHIGEMSRLTGASISEIAADVRVCAETFSHEHGIVCLLKAHRTVITDGSTTFINHSGNAGMATGGSGDVLAGIIGGLLARDAVADWADDEKRALSPTLYRAAAAAYIHGLAGDSAAKRYGQYSVTASDILGEIATVIKAFS